MISGYVDKIPRWLAILLQGVVAAVAVVASVFATNIGFDLKLGLIGIVFLTSSIVSYIFNYRPYMNLKKETKSDLIEMALEQLVTKHDSQVSRQDTDLRANVMVKTKNFSNGLIPRRIEHLKMEYKTDGYSKAEQEQQYKRGEGCAGICLKENDPTYYPGDEKNIEASLSGTKQKVTEDVHSILSVPIYAENKPDTTPVAVLNIDSTQPISETGFDKEASQTLAMRYAGIIGDVVN